MKRVLLLGAGHAQLSVLGALARQRLPGAEVALVTPSPRTWYSGMVPGLIAGRYSADDCTIDVTALAQAAGVPLHLGRAVALDANARVVTLADVAAEEWTLNISRYVLPPIGEDIPPLPEAVATFKAALARARAAENDLRRVMSEGGWLAG